MAKKIAVASGALLIVLGILGFFPNPVVGMSGVLKANQVHDVAHIAFGLLLLGISTLPSRTASTWIKILGTVYILRALLGFFAAPYGGNLFQTLLTNGADHMLHLVLGIALLAAGYLEKERKILSP